MKCNKERELFVCLKIQFKVLTPASSLQKYFITSFFTQFQLLNLLWMFSHFKTLEFSKPNTKDSMIYLEFHFHFLQNSSFIERLFLWLGKELIRIRKRLYNPNISFKRSKEKFIKRSFAALFSKKCARL